MPYVDRFSQNFLLARWSVSYLLVYTWHTLLHYPHGANAGCDLAGVVLVDETVVRSSYFHNRNLYTAKAHLYIETVPGQHPVQLHASPRVVRQRHWVSVRSAGGFPISSLPDNAWSINKRNSQNMSYTEILVMMHGYKYNTAKWYISPWNGRGTTDVRFFILRLGGCMHRKIKMIWEKYILL